jgi:putative tricarboxylic transport membrane protein
LIFFAYPLLPKLLGERDASFIGRQLGDDDRPSRSYMIGEAVVFGIAIVALMFLFAESEAYATYEEGYAFGPDIWPKTAIAGLIVFSAAKIIGLSRFWLSNQLRERSEVTLVADRTQRVVKTLCHIVVFLVYFLGIQYLGFMIGNLVFLPMIMHIAGLKGLKVIMIPVVATFLAIPFFTKLLYVSLPRGVGPFHDISTFVTKLLG